MYSSSPAFSSSSTTVLGEGDGVNKDCRLELDVIARPWDCEVEELSKSVVGRASLSGVLKDVTELVDAFLRTVRDSDSLGG